MAIEIDVNKFDDRAVATFIVRERRKALAFLHSKFTLSDDDAEDIIQDACIALFENIKNGKYTKQDARLSTYFYSICWRSACKFVTRTRHVDSLDDSLSHGTSEEYDPSQIEYILGLSDSGLTMEQKQIMRDIVQDLPSPCEEILWSYYGDNMSMKDIADLIGFKNADSTKSKKSWCVSRLKERFNKMKSLFYDK